MNKELYQKITKVYKILANKWSEPRYSDGYTYHLRERWERNDEIWNFLQQFQNVTFSTYFRKEHIQQFPVPEKYFGTNTFIIHDKEISFHYDFALVLYSYCADQLRDELVKFREMIDGELQEKFGKFVKKDEYVFRYNTIDHENIYKYILNQLPNYGLIWNLLSIGTMITIEEYHVEIRYNRIDNVINGLNNQYDFENVNIQ
jgi:hypothetical protein